MAIQIKRKSGGNIPPFIDKHGTQFPNAVIVLEYFNKWSEKEINIVCKVYPDMDVFGKDLFLDEFQIQIDEYSYREPVIDQSGNVLDVGQADYDTLFKYMKFESDGKISATSPITIAFLQSQQVQLGQENEKLGKYWDITDNEL
jgi:hypothetical protein